LRLFFIFSSNGHFLSLIIIALSLFIDESHLAREVARADAEFYSKKKQAEGNALLLTREYLELKEIEAVANNNKIYYGSDIPNVFFRS
ncbi:hypothetical protein AB6A40_011183, partial [Gnathostoma spinigerum]